MCIRDSLRAGRGNHLGIHFQIRLRRHRSVGHLETDGRVGCHERFAFARCQNGQGPAAQRTQSQGQGEGLGSVGIDDRRLAAGSDQAVTRFTLQSNPFHACRSVYDDGDGLVGLIGGFVCLSGGVCLPNRFQGDICLLYTSTA